MGKKRVMLTLDKDLETTIQNLKGFGVKDAEKCANIIRAYLLEKGYFADLNKKKG